jgi:hypothetical protein
VWMAFERAKLVNAQTTGDSALYDRHSHRFDIARTATIGLYALGAGLAVTGWILGRHSSTEGVAVSAAPIAGGGALVSVGWQR